MWIVAHLIFSPLALSIFGLSSSIFGSGSSILRNEGHSSRIDYLEMNEYTDDDKRTIKLFREVMEDEIPQKYQRSDDYLIRWLRESNMNVIAASEALRLNLKWRVKHQLDSVLNNTSYNLEGAPCAVVGIDKNGGPILIVKVMAIDLKNVLLTGKMDKIRSQTAHCIERSMQAAIRGGTKNDGIRMTPGTAIVDLKGVSALQHACLRCIKLYKDLAVYSNEYYPRYAKYIVMINVPRYIKPIIEMVKPFLSPYFKQTLHVFGPVKEEWKNFLLSIIPKDELLQEYGGTKLGYPF